MEKPDGWPSKFEIIQTPSWLRRTGRFLNRLVLGPHIFSEVSEHFNHPLDPPLESVTDWPLESDGINPDLLQMNQMCEEVDE